MVRRRFASNKWQSMKKARCDYDGTQNVQHSRMVANSNRPRLTLFLLLFPFPLALLFLLPALVPPLACRSDNTGQSSPATSFVYCGGPDWWLVFA